MNGLSESATLEQPATKVCRWSLRSIVLAITYWLVVVALIGLNGFWWWQDRPTLPIASLSRLVGGPRNAEAEAELRRIVRKSPNDGEALSLLARALASRDDTVGCAQALHLVPFWSPVKAESLYAEGLSWLELDQARRAERAFLEYLVEDPNHPETLDKPRTPSVQKRLVDLYAHENRLDDARNLIHQAYLKATPSLKQAWLTDGLRTYVERANPADTIGSLRQFVAADPEDWQARRALARAAGLLGQNDEADKAIATVLAQKPNDPKVWRDYLELLFERHDLDAVAQAIAKLPPEADTDGAIWMIRGQVDDQNGNLAAAAEAYRHAVALMPFNPKAHYRLSLVAKRLGHSQESEVQSRRHLELDRWFDDLKKTLDAYNDARDSRNTAALDAAIAKFIPICQGLGLDDEAKGWDAELEARKPARNPAAQ